LVVNLSEKNVEDSVEYWYNMIQTQVPNPIVIVVGTHKDLLPKDVRPSVLVANILRSLSNGNKSLNVTRAYSLALSNQGKVDESELFETIHTAITAQNTDFVGRKIPFSYSFFELLLKDFAKTIEFPVINQRTLLRLGEAVGFRKLNDVIECTRVLHDYGSLLYFDDVLNLRDVVVLNPLWLFGFVSNVLSSIASETRVSGIADRECLARILKRYPRNFHSQLKLLLVKFEVGFEIDGNPDLLSQLGQVISSEKVSSDAVTHSLSSVNLLKIINKTGSSARLLDVFDPIDRDLDLSSASSSSEEDEKALLLCQLLPDNSPKALLHRYFPDALKQGMSRCARFIHFEFLPTSFFPNLIVLTLGHADSLASIWRAGLLGTVKNYASAALVHIGLCAVKEYDPNNLQVSPSIGKNYVRLLGYLCRR